MRILDRVGRLQGLVLAVGVGFWVINSGATDKLLANGVLGYSGLSSLLEWLRKEQQDDAAKGDAPSKVLAEQALQRILAAQVDRPNAAPVVAAPGAVQMAPMVFDVADDMTGWEIAQEPDLKPDLQPDANPNWFKFVSQLDSLGLEPEVLAAVREKLSQSL